MAKWGILLALFVACLIVLYSLLKDEEKLFFNKLKTWWHNQDQVKRGELFLSEFQGLKIRSLLKLQQPQSGQDGFLFTPFMYYPQLLEEVLSLEKNLGVGFSDMLLEIKNSAMVDIKFIRMRQEIYRSTYFQMIIMALLIWFFITSCEKYLELHLPWSLFASVISWQFLGVGIFIFLSRFREKYYFQAYSPWFLLLYRSRLLLKSHLETADFFQKITIDLDNIKKLEKEESFEFERLSFYRVLNHCRDQGLRGDQELADLTQHLQDKRLFKLDKFQRELAFLKFFILCFFFLLTYLAFVIYLFSFFID